MKKINNRKTILINKPFQLSILAWFSLLGLLIALIFYSANLYFFKSMHDEAVLAGLAADNVFFQYLEAQKVFMNKVFFISTFISSLVIIWGGLYLSHRVAGPLLRLTAHLKTFSFADMKPLKFRKGDYFPEIQDAYNEFIQKK